MKKILNKANILGAVVSGDGLTYKRRPDLFVGDVKNGYNKGDLLDANAVAGMVTEAIQEHDADLTQLHDEISEFVNLRINELVDGAPETMDTLKEVADAIKYEIPNVVNEHEYVDLGLPSGTLWAKKNIGATSETDGGLYFAWGESRGYAVGDKEFNLGGYNFYDENAANLDFNLSKYNATDGKTILDYYDDAATIYMGDSWRMPTHAQIQELLNALNTTNLWVTNYKENGVNGLLITSVRNGNLLFLPAAGSAMNTNLLAQNEYCFYWSSEIVDNAFHTDAYNICADSNGVDANGESTRSAGRVVRGVTNELNVQPVLGELRQQINDAIESNELVIASALVDLDDRIRPFENIISFTNVGEDQQSLGTELNSESICLFSGGSAISMDEDPGMGERYIEVSSDSLYLAADTKIDGNLTVKKKPALLFGGVFSESGIIELVVSESDDETIDLSSYSEENLNKLQEAWSSFFANNEGVMFAISYITAAGSAEMLIHESGEHYPYGLWGGCYYQIQWSEEHSHYFIIDV